MVLRIFRIVLASSVAMAAAVLAQTPAPPAATTADEYVVTHHYDNARTGWDPNEHLLLPGNVNSSTFGLLHMVELDGQVDAQPLVLRVPAVEGELDVAYVATENDTVYLIDADSGTILRQRRLGTPVPKSALPGGCNNNAANIGIDSTPVIDLGSQTLYLIAYTMESGKQVYRIHALDLHTLEDKVGAGVVVTGSDILTNGESYTFNAAVSRQRSALLEADGNIYAAFGSFCDLEGNVSRGWVLGWQADTLQPLPANQLNDRFANSPTHEFLTSVWMSGAGIAEAGGNLYFVTANSDPNTYAPPTNIQESVVETSGDLMNVLGVFTPSDQQTLDATDADLGSGGVLLVPEQNSLPDPFLAFVAGKSGYVYLLNRQNFAGPTSADKIVQRLLLGGCWCTASYYQGSDGIGRIVSSVGFNVIVYKLQASGASDELAYDGNSETLKSGQDPGFFTSVSSEGTTPGTVLIWGVTRPVDRHPATIRLFAYDNVHAEPLYSAPAGTWPKSNGNANIVPIVANGRVYVASYRRLAIFGLGGSAPLLREMIVKESPAQPMSGHRITGIIKRINGKLVTLDTRSGLVEVDTTEAQAAHLSAALVIGQAVLARGERKATGYFTAQVILRSKTSSALWPPDK